MLTNQEDQKQPVLNVLNWVYWIEWNTSLSPWVSLTLKQIFFKTKTFLKKLKYRFSVENNKIESASFPYKTAIAEGYVKTNRMVSTKQPTTKNDVLPVPTLFFQKFCFILKASCNELTGILFDGSFSLWVSLKFSKA